MVKSIGIDPGTKSMDLFGFDDETGEIIADEAIPRDEITRNPEIVIKKLRELWSEHGGIHAIVGPSGYGVPLKRASETTDEEIALATFITEADVKRGLKIVGLRRLMQLMRECEFGANIWFTPGVVHLPTVPNHRKTNRIDIGTADKVYSALLAIKDQSERLGLPYGQTSLILVEIGFAYTSALAVRGGEIVDGMAGTAGFPSYLGMGFMDSELAYAIANAVEDFSKLFLFSGGAASLAGIDPFEVSIEEFIERAGSDERTREGFELLIESVVKDVASLLPSTKPREILLSGRFTRIPAFFKAAEARLNEFFSSTGLEVGVIKLQSRGAVSKEAAEGAALLANGLAGGKYSRLVDVMRLRESRGTIFDYIRLGKDVSEKLRYFKSIR
jgi:predicted butyrate kinase (DUF1464 family)